MTCLAANAAAAIAVTTTSGLSAASCSANGGSRSTRPSAQRISTTKWRPSVYPSARRSRGMPSEWPCGAGEPEISSRCAVGSLLRMGSERHARCRTTDKLDELCAASYTATALKTLDRNRSGYVAEGAALVEVCYRVTNDKTQSDHNGSAFGRIATEGPDSGVLRPAARP